MKFAILTGMLINFIALNTFATIKINFNKTVAMTVNAQSLPEVRGEIKKIDLEQNKLTIKHQEIPNLGMPGMTMVFKVDSAIKITDLAAGDQILFTVDKVNGAMTVLTLKKVN